MRGGIAMKKLLLIPLILAANSAVAESETFVAADAADARWQVTASPDRAQPAHTLSLKGPNGSASQLIYVHGSGWKHIAEAAPDSHESDIALQSMGSAVPVRSSQSLTSATSTENPPAVFIDGPTGYVFIWTHDSGWKFVGSIH
jgi:hypothetical protein